MSTTSERHKNIQISANISRKSLSTSSKKTLRFQMPHNTRLKEVLEKYLAGEIREYEQLVCSIRDNLFEDDEILSLLKEATQCISLLNRDLRLFVEAILSLKWAQKSEQIMESFKSFIVNLLCAHNYHTKFAIDKLVSVFIETETETEWPNGEPTDEDCKKFAKVHSILNILLKVIPMSKDILHQSLISNYPYMKKNAHQHEVYIQNMLWILEYKPEFSLEVYYLIFNRLIILDSNAPKHEILQFEDNNDTVFEFDDDLRLKHPLAHTLDVCLDQILNHFISECYDLKTGELNYEKTKNLYQKMIIIFDRIILPTYNIHHVQFSMLFLCSFKVTILEAFLSFLFKKVCDPSVAGIHRQSAVSYIASLLSRGNFVPLRAAAQLNRSSFFPGKTANRSPGYLNMIKSSLEHLARWIHQYISTQDGLENINSDVRVHSVFYSVCQALFYVIAFRHRDLVNSRKNISFLESLNLGKIVTCRLNPLKVCQSAILQNFAAVTRTYQLAYCYSIIEHNQRNIIPTMYLDDKGSVVTKSAVLEAFFPFDPFLLKRCSAKLSSIYLEYKGFENDSSEPKIDEDDDFLSESFKMTVQTPNKNQIDKFSYGTSPGFKYKT